MKKIMSLVMCMVMMFSCILTGCGDRTEQTSETETKKVRICSCGLYVDATKLIMREKKILEKYLPENVEIEWSQIASGPDIRDAVVSGNVDIADISLMTFITGYENGLPIDLLSFDGSTPTYLYTNRKDIKSVKDFGEGSSISITNKNTNLHLAVLALCKREAGNPLALDKYLTPIPAADALSSLQTSQSFNGAVFTFPMSVKADKVDGLNLLYDMSDLVKEYNIGSAMIANREFRKNNPDIISAFLKAQSEALKYIESNQEESADILSSLFGCEKEDVLHAFEVMPPTDKVTGYDKLAQLLYESKIIEKEPTKFASLANYESIVK